MTASKPLDVTLAVRRTPVAPPMTHDRLGRPLVGPCLIWTGKLPKEGYAMINNRVLGTAPQLVHRVAYAMATGHPLDDLKSLPELDHLCRVRACSAASHLEPVTRRENLRRGDGNQNVGKTVCDNGHEFTRENTIWRRAGNRGCRQCHRDQSREAWRRKNRPDLVGKPPMTYAQAGAITWPPTPPSGTPSRSTP